MAKWGICSNGPFWINSAESQSIVLNAYQNRSTAFFAFLDIGIKHVKLKNDTTRKVQKCSLHLLEHLNSQLWTGILILPYRVTNIHNLISNQWWIMTRELPVVFVVKPQILRLMELQIGRFTIVRPQEFTTPWPITTRKICRPFPNAHEVANFHALWLVSPLKTNSWGRTIMKRP